MKKAISAITAIAMAILMTSTWGADSPVPLIFEFLKGNEYKEKLVNEVKTARNTREDNEDYWLYSTNKISDIKEFYYPAVKIDGYELYSVEIGGYGISYFWGSSETLAKHGRDVHFYENLIIIGMTRSDIPNWNSADPMGAVIKQSKEQGWGELTEEGFIYEKPSYESPFARITAPLGGTRLTIIVPVELGDYETLRDLTLEVIRTAELVIVDEYKSPTEQPPTILENFPEWDGTGNATARINADHMLFSNITLGGIQVASENYTIEAGSTVVTLHEVYLKTLQAGTHEFVVNFTDGVSVVLPLSVSASVPSDTPSDMNPNTGISLAIIPVGIVGVLIGLLVVMNRRRERG